MVQSFVLAREPTLAARPREPRSGPRLAPSIAVPIKTRGVEARGIEARGIEARGIEHGVRAVCADRKALFLLPVLSLCASHGIARAKVRRQQPEQT